ncbi:MAG: hypothetical protein U1E73_13470 [Planctomycetota bacterium]
MVAGGERIAFTQDVLLDPQVTAQYPDLPKANARAYDDLWVRHWDHWLDGSYSHLFVRDLAATGRPWTSCPASVATRRCRRSAAPSRSRGRPTGSSCATRRAR